MVSYCFGISNLSPIHCYAVNRGRWWFTAHHFSDNCPGFFKVVFVLLNKAMVVFFFCDTNCLCYFCFSSSVVDFIENRGTIYIQFIQAVFSVYLQFQMLCDPRLVSFRRSSLVVSGKDSLYIEFIGLRNES